MRLSKILTVILASVMVFSLLCVNAGASGEPELVEKVIKFDFDEEKELTFLESGICDYFVVDTPTGDSAEIGEDGIGVLAGFSDIYTNDDTVMLFENPYEISVDYKSKSNQNAGLYFRAVHPLLYSINNSVLNVDMNFHFYELDWYAQCGGKAVDSTTYTGGSGIKISTVNKYVVIAVKVYAPDSLHTATRSVKIAFPEGKTYKEMINFRVTDNNAGLVSIYVENNLFATVEYGGEPGEYELSDTYEPGTLFFYKHAEIKNAQGEVLLAMDDAKIAAENPIFAIGNRDSTTYFNNLAIKYLAEAPKATPTPAPTGEPTQEPTEEPAQTPAATEAPKAESGSSSNTGLVIGIVAGVVVIAAAVAVILVKKKKK